ncbi:hypothetical protein KKH27_01370 [bacterium]|nr:hypothetical protein [bacterium]MBU1984548.1 hypothetical protein [bacterium]
MAAPFENSAIAAAALSRQWHEAARSRPQTAAAPSLLELQTICRETGISLPDLDNFARIRDLSPLILICGRDSSLAASVAELFGLHPQWPELPEAPLIWCVSGDPGPKIRVRHGSTEQEISRRTLGTLLGAKLPPAGFLVIEEHTNAPHGWSLGWIPRPNFMESPDGGPTETEFLLRQRAALVVEEETPLPVAETLKELNQKLWIIRRSELESEEDRRRILAELATLAEDRPEHLALRITATWRWLVNRLLNQIEGMRSEYKQRLNRFDIKIASAAHLLRQYRTNWIGGIRTLVESHLGQRAGGTAFASFLDAGKPGPQAGTFVSALALNGLGNKLDEYLTDRMADLVGGLDGLATKLELRRIPLGDANVRWDIRTLSSRVEAHLTGEKVFPLGGGKRAGLAANLTGRKQQVTQERKDQLARGVREAAKIIVQDFTDWSMELTSSLEQSIHLQLTAELANHGLPDADGLRVAQAGLDRLEESLRSRKEATIRPEATLAEWLAALSRGGLIPLFQPT